MLRLLLWPYLLPAYLLLYLERDYMRFYTFRLLGLYLLGALLVGSVQAQTRVGLVAHYNFEGDLTDFTGNSANGGVAAGVPAYGCGVEGQAIQLFGGNDFVRIPGGTSNNINREFDTEDFTLSFYFKPVGFNGTQYLISKRDTACAFEQFFYIRYAPSSRTVSAYLRQGNQEMRINHRIENFSCWQHLVLVRENRRVRMYINTDLVGDQGTTSRVDIFNSGELTFGSANCLGNNETSFVGLLDEIRIYNRALNFADVETLYTFPDRILNPDQRLFLGESLPMEVNANCGIGFAWSPIQEVSDPTIAAPTITPTMAGERSFVLQISDAESGCVAVDSIRLQVIDPTMLDCSTVFLPKAFTPNGIGPTANETFGISNPFAIPELISFEIFDRWGGKVFTTANAFERWDGSFAGQAINPGVFLWRVVFRCEQQEVVSTGSVTVLR